MATVRFQAGVGGAGTAFPSATLADESEYSRRDPATRVPGPIATRAGFYADRPQSRHLSASGRFCGWL